MATTEAGRLDNRHRAWRYALGTAVSDNYSNPFADTASQLDVINRQFAEQWSPIRDQTD